MGGGYFLMQSTEKTIKGIKRKKIQLKSSHVRKDKYLAQRRKTQIRRSKQK